jgi:hypothetical protein
MQLAHFESECEDGFGIIKCINFFYHSFHCDETFRNQSSLSSGKEFWKQRILRSVIPKKKYILFLGVV